MQNFYSIVEEIPRGKRTFRVNITADAHRITEFLGFLYESDIATEVEGAAHRTTFWASFEFRHQKKIEAWLHENNIDPE